MPSNVVFKIDTQGNTTFLVSEHTKAFMSKKAKQFRASHVVPTDKYGQRLFLVLRRMYNDESKVAAWTRTWRCQWQADLSPVNGPVLGPFDDRQAAIDAEVEWLNKNFLAVKK